MKLSALTPFQAIKLRPPLTMQPMKLPASPTPPSQDQMILMFMASVYLLYLPLVFEYLLHITLPQPKKRLFYEKTD